MNRNFKGFDLNLPHWYKDNNPAILKRIEVDLKAGNQFNYLFIGNVGTGKTLLADTIYNQFRCNNPRIDNKYIRAMDIYQEYLGVMMSNYTDKLNALEKRIRCLEKPFVIFDDLGTEKPSTDSSRQFIETILINHYNYVLKYCSSSIISTNLTGDDIADKYGNRVLDRIHDAFTIMKFNNHSFRQEKTEIIG